MLAIALALLTGWRRRKLSPSVVLLAAMSLRRTSALGRKASVNVCALSQVKPQIAVNGGS
jgi:hypothetical protein